MGTPIINLPQTGECLVIAAGPSSTDLLLTAVLGLHAIKEKPIAVNGKVEIRPVRTLFHGSST